jgi:hypothetical protein
MNQEQPKEQTINIDAIRLRHSDISRVAAKDLEDLCNALVMVSNQLKEAHAKIKELEAVQEK